MDKVTQVGLTTDSQVDVDSLVNRVDKFNQRFAPNRETPLVELEIYEVPEKLRKFDDGGRFRLLFTYADKAIVPKFWTE